MHYPIAVTSPLIQVTDANKYYPVDFGSRGWLQRLQLKGPNNATIDIFGRAFTWDTAIDVQKIEDDGNGKVQITAYDDLPLAVDDVVLVASSGVGAYNVEHRVKSGQAGTSVTGGKVIVTNIPFSQAVFFGKNECTVTLKIPTDEYALYRLVPRMTIDVNSTTLLFNDDGRMDIINMDPPCLSRKTRNSYPIYCKFSATGDYRLSANIVA